MTMTMFMPTNEMVTAGAKPGGDCFGRVNAGSPTKKLYPLLSEGTFRFKSDGGSDKRRSLFDCAPQDRICCSTRTPFIVLFFCCVWKEWTKVLRLSLSISLVLYGLSFCLSLTSCPCPSPLCSMLYAICVALHSLHSNHYQLHHTHIHSPSLVYRKRVTYTIRAHTFRFCFLHPCACPIFPSPLSFGIITHYNSSFIILGSKLVSHFLLRSPLPPQTCNRTTKGISYQSHSLH